MQDGYSFGTGSIAAQRLHLVARVFEPTMVALLDAVGLGPVDRVLDLGCGPGSSTGSLMRLVTADEVVGIDGSPAFVAEAARNLPAARFLVGDVTDPWPSDAHDLAYARCLLAHLPDPVAVAGRWQAQLAPGGRLLLEEPETIDTGVAVYRRYLTITEALVASRGAAMYAGTELRGQFAGAVIDRPFVLDVAAADASAMFTMNLASWRTDPWIIEHVDAGELGRLADDLRATPTSTSEPVRWTVRQIALAAADPVGGGAR